MGQYDGVADAVAYIKAIEARLNALATQVNSGAIHLQPIPAGAGWTSSAFYSRIGRQVVLQGSFSKTSGTPTINDVMGTLPDLTPSIRPATQMVIEVSTENNDTRGMILINTSGDLVWRVGSTVETDATFIDGIAYVV